MLKIIIISILLNLSIMAKAITVGIIAPVQMTAMDEIIEGFKTQLRHDYAGKINFIVKNAQGDLNIQRAIISQLQRQHVDLLVPIGTSTAQMTAHLEQHIPIVALAAMLESTPDNVTSVLDEIDIAEQLHFLQQVHPHLKKLTLIHSTDPKIFAEVKQLQQVCQHQQIARQVIMMQQLADLYSLSQHVDTDSDALFVLKDTQVISGISTLVQQIKHIPIISSDDGSVKAGASLALGVRERTIGTNGAKHALQVLHGKHPRDLAPFKMNQYTVFMNEERLKKDGFDLNKVKRLAQEYHYEVISL